MDSIEKVKAVLSKQVAFELVQNRPARFVLIGVRPGEEVVDGCVEGFSQNAVRVVDCLASLGIITRNDEREFINWYYKCSRQKDKDDEIARLLGLSKKHGFELVKGK